MTESSGASCQKIVCVLGMHRSGTSLLTRLLNLIGVSLGPEKSLLPPNEGNPRGYWEHGEFLSINDEILKSLGGLWHELPWFPPGWENDPTMDQLKQRARALIQDTFANDEFWGWKDPRSCLTLPFWQQLLPDMRYVVCLRNPVDVAHSLEHRDDFSLEKSSKLWLTYVNSAMEHTDGRPRLVTCYEDLMDDWLGELRRLANFLGRPERAEEVDVQEAVQVFMEKGLQHHRTSLVQTMASPRVALRTRALYLAQRISVSCGRKEVDSHHELDEQIAEALDVLSQYSFRASGQLNPLVEQLAELDKQVEESRKTSRVLQARLLEQEQDIAILRTQMHEMENVIRARDEAIAWLGRHADELDSAVAWLRAQADGRKNVIRARDEAISWLREKVDERENVIRARDEAIAWLKAQVDERVRGRDGAIAVLEDGLSPSGEVSL